MKPRNEAWLTDSSFHPGGVNAAMADGSVKFLKDTMASWPISPATADPEGVITANGFTRIGTARPQVYQALSTRNGGEVISADSY